MDLVEPHLMDVVPLFRALHTYHAELDPSVYHCDAPDGAFLEILQGAMANGGRVFAHDAGWGLVSYVLAKPDIVERDYLRCRHRLLRVDHLYVAPIARGLKLGHALIHKVEDWARADGYDGWNVIYDAQNRGVADFYTSAGANAWKGMNVRYF